MKLKLREGQDLSKLTQVEAAEAEFEPISHYLPASSRERGQLPLYQHNPPAS